MCELERVENVRGFVLLLSGFAGVEEEPEEMKVSERALTRRRGTRVDEFGKGVFLI